MTLATMLVEWRKIIREEDATNSHSTDAQGTAWANECYRTTLARLDAIPIKERDYTSASEITLNSRMVTINEAYLNVQPQNKFQRISVMSLADLAAIDSQWPSANTGVPWALVRKDSFTAILYPPPNSDNTGQTLRTYGLEFPSDMSAGTDTPSLPLNLHDIFPNFMAYKHFLTVKEPSQAKIQLDLFDARFQTQRNVSTKFSNQQMRWRFDGEA